MRELVSLVRYRRSKHLYFSDRAKTEPLYLRMKPSVSDIQMHLNEIIGDKLSRRASFWQCTLIFRETTPSICFDGSVESETRRLYLHRLLLVTSNVERKKWNRLSLVKRMSGSCVNVGNRTIRIRRIICMLCSFQMPDDRYLSGSKSRPRIQNI